MLEIKENTKDLLTLNIDTFHQFWFDKEEGWELFIDMIDALDYLVPFLEKDKQKEVIDYLGEKIAYLNKIIWEDANETSR